jgi:hypothetical protein
VFTLATDGVAGALEQAKRVAGEKVVLLFGATVMQQALPLGLVDEIHLHLVACLIGAGIPLSGTLVTSISLERTQAVITPSGDAPELPSAPIVATQGRRANALPARAIPVRTPIKIRTYKE